MQFLGIDPGLDYCGVAIIADDADEQQRFGHTTVLHPTGEDWITRLADLSHQLDRHLRPHEGFIQLAVVERPIMGKHSNPDTFGKQNITVGMIFQVLTAYTPVIRFLLPKQVRKLAVGDGGATADQVRDYLTKIGYTFTTSRVDESDALAMAIAARQVWMREA